MLINFLATIMKTIFLQISRSFMLVFCGFLCLTGAAAETGQGVAVAEDRGSLRDAWKKLSPEEREELRRQMRDSWQRLPREDQERLQQACRERDGARGGGRGRPGNDRRGKGGKGQQCGYKTYWHDLSKEEREALRSKLREALSQKEMPGREMPPESAPATR
ncbi:MAG: hypothetical protein FWH15_09400 [Betaproteobacteria bacterium]|nr:hypothetical protein [Betaproteobacteria bacterium]